MIVKFREEECEEDERVKEELAEDESEEEELVVEVVVVLVGLEFRSANAISSSHVLYLKKPLLRYSSKVSLGSSLQSRASSPVAISPNSIFSRCMFLIGLSTVLRKKG